MISEELKKFKNSGIVYGLVDPDTKFLRYIGKSIQGVTRCFEHFRDCSIKEGNTPKNNWINKLKNNNKIYDVVILFSEDKSNFSKEDLNNKLYEIEQNFIKEYKPFGKLLNLADGGPGSAGVKRSTESKEKMRKAKEGKDFTFLRELAKSRKNSPEKANQIKEDKKLRLKQRNRKIPGSRFNDSSKRGKRIIAKDLNGNQIISFYNLRGAASTMGGKASHNGIKMAIKKNSMYYGYFWEFLNA